VRTIVDIARLRLLFIATTAPSITLTTAPIPIINTGIRTSHRPDDVDVAVVDEVTCELVPPDEATEVDEPVTKTVIV